MEYRLRGGVKDGMVLQTDNLELPLFITLEFWREIEDDPDFPGRQVLRVTAERFKLIVPALDEREHADFASISSIPKRYEMPVWPELTDI